MFKSCLNCRIFKCENCFAVKEDRFATKQARKNYLKETSENCLDYEQDLSIEKKELRKL